MRAIEYCLPTSNGIVRLFSAAPTLIYHRRARAGEPGVRVHFLDGFKVSIFATLLIQFRHCPEDGA